jgi:hypothetical protein
MTTTMIPRHCSTITFRTRRYAAFADTPLKLLLTEGNAPDAAVDDVAEVLESNKDRR